MSERYEVVLLEAFPPGARIVYRIRNREIGVFNVDGQVYALPNMCPHQIGPLCTGKVSGTFIKNKATGWRPEWVEEGEIITCPWHGLEFRIKTGQCLAYPEIKLRSYTTVIENGKVYVEL